MVRSVNTDGSTQDTALPDQGTKSVISNGVTQSTIQPDQGTTSDECSTNMDNAQGNVLANTDISSFTKTDNVECDLCIKSDDSSSTTSILNRSGLSGKKLNVSFHEQADICCNLDHVHISHSTPSSSPSKAMKAARMLASDIPCDVRLVLDTRQDMSDFISTTEPLIALKVKYS
jgi:hypothetical protein